MSVNEWQTSKRWCKKVKQEFKGKRRRACFGCTSSVCSVLWEDQMRESIYSRLLKSRLTSSYLFMLSIQDSSVKTSVTWDKRLETPKALYSGGSIHCLIRCVIFLESLLSPEKNSTKIVQWNSIIMILSSSTAICFTNIHFDITDLPSLLSPQVKVFDEDCVWWKKREQLW